MSVIRRFQGEQVRCLILRALADVVAEVDRLISQNFRVRSKRALRLPSRICQAGNRGKAKV